MVGSKNMSDQMVLSTRDLNELFNEVETGLKDKSRTINSISDSKTKKIVKKGCAVATSVITTGVGGAAKYASIGICGVSNISNAMINVAKKRTTDILGGSIIALYEISTVISKITKKSNKRNIETDRESLKQEVILKQTRIIKEMEETINRLDDKNEELQERLDYLVGMLVSLGAIEEAYM